MTIDNDALTVAKRVVPVDNDPMLIDNYSLPVDCNTRPGCELGSATRAASLPR